MNIFNFNRSPNRYQINSEDREWTEDSFKWLIDVYGELPLDADQLTVNEQSFPISFSQERPTVQSLINDLCEILGVDQEKVTYEFLEDMRDSGLPYEIEGQLFECETVIGIDEYKIYMAHSLRDHTDRLLFNLAYEFIKIRLSEDKLEYNTGDDTDLFIYVAGVYLGLGVILVQNLEDIGRSNDGLWETKWRYVAEIPKEVVVFGLALFAHLSYQTSPYWKQHLSRDKQTLLVGALDYLKDHPSPSWDENRAQTIKLFEESDNHFQQGEFQEAINHMQGALFLAPDNFTKSNANNNIGYYHVFLGNLQEAIENLQQALALDPEFAFANDNLGYALVLSGELAAGKKFLDKAITSNENDMACSHRNQGLYYQNLGDFKEAEKHYRISFESTDDPIDFLEYHFAELLYLQHKEGEALKYLQRAVARQEPRAIKLFMEKGSI